MITATKEIAMISRAKIKPDPEQPRKFFDPDALATLKDSIQANGLQVPISIKPSPTHTLDGCFLIVGGERRWRCCGELGIEELPCFIMDADTDALIWGMVDNIERENLNAMEEAWGIVKLLERGLSQADIARRLSRSPTHVSRMVLLVKLPEEIQQAVATKKFTANAGIMLVQRCSSQEEMTQNYEEFRRQNNRSKKNMTIGRLKIFLDKRERLARLSEKGIDPNFVRATELATNLPAAATRLFSLLDELITLADDDPDKFAEVWNEIPRAERPKLEGVLRAVSLRSERLLQLASQQRSQTKDPEKHNVPLRVV